MLRGRGRTRGSGKGTADMRIGPHTEAGLDTKVRADRTGGLGGVPIAREV